MRAKRELTVLRKGVPYSEFKKHRGNYQYVARDVFRETTVQHLPPEAGRDVVKVAPARDPRDGPPDSDAGEVDLGGASVGQLGKSLGGAGPGAAA